MRVRARGITSRRRKARRCSANDSVHADWPGLIASIRATGAERFVWNKMITGGFRAGVAQALVVRALAAVAGIDAPLMAHRLAGGRRPTAGDFRRLLRDSGADELARPYAFCLASSLDGVPASLGEIADWQAEWISKGVRAIDPPSWRSADLVAW